MRWPLTRLLASVLAVWALAAGGPALAAIQVPSCYAAARLPLPPGVPQAEFVVLVDQTTMLDATLLRNLEENVLRELRPGVHFSILTFSAYNQGRYMTEVASGTVEPSMAPAVRNAVGSQTLRRLDACLVGQRTYAQRLARAEIEKAAGAASSTLARSDIMGSIKEASALFSRSPARLRILLVASDMLENSSTTSFYARGGVRRIDPAAELAKARTEGLLANLRGARVYVLGGALLAPEQAETAETSRSNGAYRDATTLERLRTFWAGYLAASQGQLVEFGAPTLLMPLP